VKAKCSPNKCLEKPNEKPAISKVHLIMQGPHQTDSLDINNPKLLSAPFPPLIDSAPASATEHATIYNVPYHRAINIFTWATSATHPDTTFSDVNSSIAVD
jgi:hypothetical protein